MGSAQSLRSCNDHGLDFIQVDSIERAICFVELGSCAAIIVDPFLVAEQDAFEFIRIIKDQYNGWPEIPVIVWSKDLEPGIVAYAWSIGVDQCLRKPSDPYALIGYMFDAIENRD